MLTALIYALCFIVGAFIGAAWVAVAIMRGLSKR